MIKKVCFIFIVLINAQLVTAQSAEENDTIEVIDEAGVFGESKEIEFVESDKDYAEAQNEKWDLRQVDRDQWEETKKDKRFIYKKEKIKKRKQSKPPRFDGIKNFFNSGLAKLFLYMLFGAFLLYVIYLFLKNNDISFRKNVKDEEIEKEDPWENVKQFDAWELALQNALKDNNYRLATRIYYLHTLNILNTQNIIQYKDDKTNWYYVQKLFGTAHHDGFKELTKSFDYIWYGEYEINEDQFRVLENQFKHFHSQIIR